mgnify:CR=1 FL=1
MEPPADLPQNIKNSIEWYTDYNYMQFNEDIREGNELTSEQKKHYKNIVEAFDLTKPIPKPIEVYRGISLRKPEDYQVFGEGFVSTTMDKSVAIGFIGLNCCIVRIIVPAGSKCMDIDSLSVIPGEKELLLSNIHGKFKMTHVSREVFTWTNQTDSEGESDSDSDSDSDSGKVEKMEIDVINLMYVPEVSKSIDKIGFKKALKDIVNESKVN